MERRLDDDPPVGAGEHLDLDRVDVVTVERLSQCCVERVLVLAVCVIEEMTVDEVGCAHVEQRQRSSVGGVHHELAVEQQHRLGEFVEQSAHLGAGRLDGGQLPLEQAALTARVPDAQPERDDRR